MADYDEVTDGMYPLGERLQVLVEKMAKRCPKLENVSIAGPKGYEVADYYFDLNITRENSDGEEAEGRKVEGDREDKLKMDSERDVDVEFVIRIFK